MKIKNNQEGIAHLVAILAIVVVVAIGFVGWKVWDNRQTNPSNTKDSTNQKPVAEAPSTIQQTKKELSAGDFGNFGNYGTFQAEGYAKVFKVLDDNTANCGMSNPGVECPKINGVFFVITKSPNTKILPYIKFVKETYPSVPTNSLIMGCPANDTIQYSNMSDDASKDYTINSVDTAKILASTVEKPITLEITKKKQSFGKDAPSCYSDFTSYKLIN